MISVAGIIVIAVVGIGIVLLAARMVGTISSGNPNRVPCPSCGKMIMTPVASCPLCGAKLMG